MFKNGYRDGYRKRATNQKKWRERERERAYVKGVFERNNKKIEKIDYLKKIDGRIDGLMWSILRSGYVK